MEHFYQSKKFEETKENKWFIEEIINQSTPNKSRVLATQKVGGGYKWRTDMNPIIKKSIKDGIKMRKDWDDIKLDIMITGVCEKFKQNPKFKAALMTTKGKLYENSPRDSYWGIGKDKKGENYLGIILELIREITSNRL